MTDAALGPDQEVSALNQAGRFDDAERLVRRYLPKLEPSPQLLTAFAVSLVGQSEYVLAGDVARRALSATEDFYLRHAALRELIVCLAQTGQVDAGRELVDLNRSAYDRGIASDMAWPGIFLWILGLAEQARESHLAALARYPEDPYLLHQLGAAELSLGRYSGMRYFRMYTSRAFWARFYPEPDVDLARMWQGESLDGKSIVIRPHGGVGDFIQFIRYARILRELGARDVIAVLPSERIRGFLGSCPHVRLGSMADMTHADFWVPAFGLCGNLFESYGTLATSSYLRAPSSPLAAAQLQLIRSRARGRRCLALAWHSDMADGSMRSVPLGALLPLLGLPNIHWVITQRGIGLRQFLAAGLNAQCTVISETATFDDTSALMAGLDGVVAPESYSVHMAGAQGLPTWFLAGRALDWRHLNEETRSIWYPSVRLVRQPAMGDWRSVISDLKSQLLNL